jgi:hypothetical protein
MQLRVDRLGSMSTLAAAAGRRRAAHPTHRMMQDAHTQRMAPRTWAVVLWWWWFA